MNKFILVSKLSFKLLFLCILAFSESAIAQLKVSPVIIETKAQRGQTQNIISITNNSSQPSRIRVYAEPFTYSQNNGFQTLPAKTSNDLTPYLQFSPRELVIQPGQTRRVRVISRLVPNLPDGEYRAVIFSENLTETYTNNQNGVNIATLIGVTLYLTKGDIYPNIAVSSAIFNHRKNNIELLVNNQGKASSIADINWTLSRGNTVVGKGKINTAVLIAQGKRNFQLDFADKVETALTPGAYQLSGELIWGENKQNKLPFNLNLTIPASSATSQKK